MFQPVVVGSIHVDSLRWKNLNCDYVIYIKFCIVKGDPGRTLLRVRA